MEEITTLLERIAVALEEQNRFNWQWLEQNRAWHEENKERDIGPRVVAIHEENAKRDKVHRERMRRIEEENVLRINETLQALYDAQLENFKKPSRELVRAVGEALASDMRTGGRE